MFGNLVLIVGVFRLFVEVGLLLDQAEAFDAESLACGIDGGDPRVVLAVRGTHLGDELAHLVLEGHDRRLHRCLGLHGWHG